MCVLNLNLEDLFEDHFKGKKFSKESLGKLLGVDLALD